MHCLEFAPAVKLDIMTPEGMVSAFPCPKTISAQSPGLKPRELLPSAYYSEPKNHFLCNAKSDPSSFTLLKPCPSFPPFSTPTMTMLPLLPWTQPDLLGGHLAAWT